jgi:2-polyprenyl-3-methyl-5-hydroxy-6-metoxy-1,4-benzoquinol methylase
MDEAEIRKAAELEDRHWWYTGRRAMVRRELANLPPGRALDVGCGSGGNSEVLRQLGWDVTALDASEEAVGATRRRGLRVVRGDVRQLPFRDGQFDLVLSTDVWEHVADERQVADEAHRVLRPGGSLFVAVPCGMDLWSAHDVVLGHHRRYEKETLVALVESSGFRVEEVFGWNVLLRLVASARRRRRRTWAASRSEMEPVNPVLNMGLRAIVGLEALLPVRRRRGVSLVLRGTRP